MAEDRPLDHVRVVPRTVAVRSARADTPTAGAARAKHGLVEEPSLFAGVRPYQPGDPIRRIHWKATARVGRPVSRRFDPAREREVLLAVDMQTVAGASWQLTWDEDLVEGLCVAALSLARSFIADGVAVGLAVNAYSDRPQRTVFLPPSATPNQLALIADYLADVSPFASMPFDRLLAGVARRAPMGCAVVALSGRDPSDVLPVLRRLGAQGYRPAARLRPRRRSVERACALVRGAQRRLPIASRLADRRCARTRGLSAPSRSSWPARWRPRGSAGLRDGPGLTGSRRATLASRSPWRRSSASRSGRGAPAGPLSDAAALVGGRAAALGWLLPLGPAAAGMFGAPGWPPGCTWPGSCSGSPCCAGRPT